MDKNHKVKKVKVKKEPKQYACARDYNGGMKIRRGEFILSFK